MKNYYEIRGDVTEINLSKYNLITIIDTEELPKVLSLGEIDWIAKEASGVKWTYVTGVINKKPIVLHRFLTNAPHGMVVDHINHNTLDNRKCNLQILTNTENLAKRNNIKYEWHEMLANELIEQSKGRLIEKLAKLKKHEKMRKARNKKEISTRKNVVAVPLGIEWNATKKRFEQNYEYKII